ncbi:prolyl 4-hydroxylase subunit alpha [Chitinophaga caeni]|uniref:Prolyl 4-hydroxylase subunit alpha n=1 Tax=Chitinophaga caeni TaxID=2029983 RepID=A0A291QQC5_9BACT|nr:2OG-Fe(II) oxygenase [Chitinophaga caeni]ATL46131.1 prolyl 4-hydroxylase subunit alpha [Chitinophaga caeni]
MMPIKHRLAQYSWETLRLQLHEQGFAILPRLFYNNETKALVEQFDAENLYRKTVIMERYRFGRGTYKYYKDPLPNIIHHTREALYSFLAPVANLWMEQLKIDIRYPQEYQSFYELCRKAGQELPASLILSYETGGFNTLHQDLYGDIYFPMQAVVGLNQPGKDYEGGEFVLVQQNPRAQSSAKVIRLHEGDMLIFTTQFRPYKGKYGYAKLMLKHGVSEVTYGRRSALGIIFHLANQ